MIQIVQGNNHRLVDAEVHVVIDVIRAFTVAHYAFIRGAERIILAGSLEEAFRFKQNHPESLLAGEISGLPIPGFDLDNSPARIAQTDLAGKTLIQKTTNGVEATLNSLNAKHIFVTGFSNAATTAAWIKNRLMGSGPELSLHLIASHPTGDDDLACAEYIAGILSGDSRPTAAQTLERIRASAAAAKFFDPEQPAFLPEDMELCLRERSTEFVMKVAIRGGIPVIEREDVN
ncbi:MAG: 2-phosphosulfolactate phosphatase [Paenibacillaceae bacterium]|uniref:Probable 2-phosphosulfolactate phosphatase n=1 Tax=Paenibacillus mellifer TaxID=2937794 RepID=A0A9X1Y8Q2_9BACL|nr:2-phosphosulfolactate phosphatase [Paenibacillus mellifer]MBW4840149.1 2-phosphosulfolactate phosphatase [Paenibacillaceae bacterium]MCK8489367.1 2-phosphosulfolactate phosphatase [Paenibacillus mellifer]